LRRVIFEVGLVIFLALASCVAVVQPKPLSQVHDIAVINLTISKTIVGQTYVAYINVTVENQGDFSESFNVSVFANSTLLIGSNEVILQNGSSTLKTITWDTSSFNLGNYEVSAYVEPIPGEVDIEDNSLIGPLVTVSIPGDMDRDFDVDIFDIIRLCRPPCWIPEGCPPPPPELDIDSDGDLDIFDIVIACMHYGEKYTP